MSKRILILAVTGFALSVAACGSYGTSVVEGNKPPAHVASVSLTVPLSLITGQTARAVAVPKDANGAALSGRAVSWFTSSAAIASVTDSGLVSAVAPGSAVVSAVSEGVSGQATIGVTPPTPTPIATVTVVVSPPSVLTGQTAHATATLLDSTGKQILGRPITWQSSKATVAAVAATGDVTALGPGTAMISASSEGKSASAVLSVTAPPPVPVASVNVALASSSLNPGQSTQATATTRDANNNPLTGRVVIWSSANPTKATVNSTSGLVTAVDTGTAQITATSEGKTGSATVTITPPPPPPPPGSSNEPSGMTVISDRPFTAANELGWADGGGSGEFDFRTDASAPHSAPGIMHAWFPAGYPGGAGPVAMRKTFTGYRTIYLRYWARYSANYQGHGSGVNKMLYMYPTAGISKPVLSATGTGSGALRPQIRMQNSIIWSPGSGSENLDPNIVPNATIPRGQWFLIEAIFVGNTPGNRDGSVDWWLNGVHVGSYSVQWQTGAQLWGEFHGTTIWGGTGDIATALMWVDWDHVYLSGKN